MTDPYPSIRSSAPFGTSWFPIIVFVDLLPDVVQAPVLPVDVDDRGRYAWVSSPVSAINRCIIPSRIRVKLPLTK